MAHLILSPFLSSIHQCFFRNFIGADIFFITLFSLIIYLDFNMGANGPLPGARFVSSPGRASIFFLDFWDCNIFFENSVIPPHSQESNDLCLMSAVHVNCTLIVAYYHILLICQHFKSYSNSTIFSMMYVIVEYIVVYYRTLVQCTMRILFTIVYGALLFTIVCKNTIHQVKLSISKTISCKLHDPL